MVHNLNVNAIYTRDIASEQKMCDSNVRQLSVNEKISTIAGINKDGQKINLLGIVLQKSGVRRVGTKDTQQGNRGVFSFVLRDNVTSWINVIYWGTTKSSRELSASFSIGKLPFSSQISCQVTSSSSYKAKQK